MGIRHSFTVAVLICAGAVVSYSQTPQVATGGVLNGASFDKTGQPVAPGSLVSIFGTNLAAATASAGSVPISTSLSSVTVTFNNIPAPISYTSPGQVNAQVPWETLALLPPGTSGSVQMSVVVSNNGVLSTPTTVSLAPVSPGIFTFPGGVGQAIAVNADGSIAAPGNAGLPFTSHPAKAGDALVIYATGLGAVDTKVADGDVPTVITSKATQQPTILVGGQPAQVLFAGLVGRDSSGQIDGFVGAYQINFTVPSGTGTGTVPLQIQMNGITSRNDVTIAVSN
ncbi:MAG TPA: IPT/TIG domain-containing protein [Bryobacteraceae bacterium]|nr:IPT/TIG domain-containing protein [Bryobacteraceae bacterium]